MVAKVHPSTLKSIEAKGFQVTGGPEDEAYTLIWAEKNRRISSADLKAALADMVLLKTIVLEYPDIKAVQVKDTDGFTSWTLKKGRKLLAEGWPLLTEAWDAYISSEGDEADGDGDGDEADGDEGRSIVRRKYRDAYRPNQHTNGDDLARQMKDHLTDDGHIDRAKLVRFAKANKVWDEKYENLNNGQVRMNVGNRIRARLRKEAEYSVAWVK